MTTSRKLRWRCPNPPYREPPSAPLTLSSTYAAALELQQLAGASCKSLSVNSIDVFLRKIPPAHLQKPWNKDFSAGSYRYAPHEVHAKAYLRSQVPFGDRLRGARGESKATQTRNCHTSRNDSHLPVGNPAAHCALPGLAVESRCAARGRELSIYP